MEDCRKSLYYIGNPPSDEDLDKFVPQWFCFHQTELLAATVISPPAFICTFDEIIDFGQQTIRRFLGEQPRTVRFYYASQILLFQDIAPWKGFNFSINMN